MIFIILSTLVIILTLKFLVTYKNRLVSLPPGPRGWPFLGNVLEVDFERLHKTLLEWKMTYGDVVHFSLFGDSIVSMNSADVLDELYAKEPNATICSDRADTYVGAHVMFRYKDIGLAKYNKDLLALRKMVNTYTRGFGSNADALEKATTGELKRTVCKLHELTGKPFDCKNVITRTTGNFFSALLVGEHFDYDDPALRTMILFSETLNFFLLPQVNALMLKFPFLAYVPGKYRRLVVKFFATRDKFLRRFVQNYKETFDSSKMRGIVDQLISEHIRTQVDGGDTWMTHEHVMAVSLDIIGAGMEATASVLSTMMLFLLHRPDVQTKLQEEVDRVIGDERLPSLTDRRNMPYYNAFVLETMRYCPVGPTGIAKRLTEDIKFRDFILPKSTKIIHNVWAITHDEKIWKSPWEFNPERFMGEDGQMLSPEELKKFKFHPFGVGKRTCVGEAFGKSRMFLFITTVLQKFTFVPVIGEDLPYMDPRTFVGTVNLGPANFTCSVIARQNGNERLKI